MTEDIPVLEVDEDIAKATNSLAESFSDDINLMEVHPPREQSEGMDVADKLLESVHLLEMNDRLLRSSSNESPTCGMELWYDNNQVKFVFCTPSDEIEKEYRQQISGYYDQSDIASITSEEGMFIRTDPDKNESVAVTDLYLNSHYYNPIASPQGDESDLDSDPYQRLLNEIDSKDDTRAMLQVLYKPAPYNWTEQQHETLETYAKKIKNKGGYKTRWFGFKVDEVDNPGIWEQAAANMRGRINEPAYFVNVRLAVITTGQTQDQADSKAEARARSITNAIDHLYGTKAGQSLTPRSYSVNGERNAKETLINMIKRNPENMSQERSISKLLWQKLTSKTSTIVLTAGELSGLVHLPSYDEITSGAVKWNKELVNAEVPPDVDEFEPVDKEEADELEEEPDLDSGDDDSGEAKQTDDSQSALFDR